jgi:predicted HicB family RNase H-like nuclease
MGNLRYKGYIGSVEYSEQDNILFGKVLGMSKDAITYEGETIDRLKADFEAGVDDYLASCAARGVEPRKAYSGLLNIRIPPDTHGRLAAIAKTAGTSINNIINSAISDFARRASVL